MAVNTVFYDYSSYGSLILILAAVMYSLQLYTDFSGCMDLVCGVSRLFGVKLSLNFRQPFFSESIAEFWRRWHITLGAFFRKYIYIPLGGNRKGKFRKHLNQLIVFFLSGLWHGGNWTFVIGTGLLHVFYMICGDVLRPLGDAFCKATRISREAMSLKLFRKLRTFLLVTIGFVFFRSESVFDALAYFKSIFVNFNALYTEDGYEIISKLSADNLGLAGSDIFILIIGLLILLFVSLRAERKAENESQNVGFRSIAAKAPESLGGKKSDFSLSLSQRENLVIILFLAVLLFGMYGRGYNAQAFIYSTF